MNSQVKLNKKKDWVVKTLGRDSQTYKVALRNFGKQFKDIKEIKEIYINSDNKVFAAMWIDNRGVLNFNSGFQPDIVKTIKFK